MNFDLPDDLSVDYLAEQLDAVGVKARPGRKPEERHAEFRNYSSGWAEKMKIMKMGHGALQDALKRHPNHIKLQNAVKDVVNKMAQHNKQFDDRVAKLGRTENKETHRAFAMANCRSQPKRSENVVRIINDADRSSSAHRSSSSSASSSKSIGKPGVKTITKSTSKQMSSKSRRH